MASSSMIDQHQRFGYGRDVGAGVTGQLLRPGQHRATSSSSMITASARVVAWRVNMGMPWPSSTPPFKSMPWTWTSPALIGRAAQVGAVASTCAALPEPW